MRTSPSTSHIKRCVSVYMTIDATDFVVQNRLLNLLVNLLRSDAFGQETSNPVSPEGSVIVCLEKHSCPYAWLTFCEDWAKIMQNNQKKGLSLVKGSCLAHTDGNG